MNPTVTLAQTTLANGVDAESTRVKVGSSAGLTPGVCLWMDTELMSVVSLGVTDSLGTWVNVRRGVGGSIGQSHSQAIPVTIGNANQFYQTDPVGRPPAAPEVSPWINTVNGKTWIAVGDSATNNNVRYWTEQVNTHGIGAFGVRTNAYAVTDVTSN